MLLGRSLMNGFGPSPPSAVIPLAPASARYRRRRCLAPSINGNRLPGTLVGDKRGWVKKTFPLCLAVNMTVR